MSDFVRHESCPQCFGSDPLGRFDDGHAFCFSCGWYESGSKFKKFKQVSAENNNKNATNNVFLPYDCTDSLPIDVINWLFKYGISNKEIAQYQFKWSPSWSRLVFPIYDKVGKLRFWQGRHFGPHIDKVSSKYFTVGLKDDYDVIPGDGDVESLVVVEDYISAIKVSRTHAACPIFGSSISTQRTCRFALRYSEIVLWLDFDKRKAAFEWKVKNKVLFRSITPVFVTKDPKDYSDDEIAKIIQGVV